MSNIENEKLFLSGLLKNRDFFFQSCDFLTPQDFSHLSTRSIYDVIHSLYIDKEFATLSKKKIISEAKNLGINNFLSLTKNGEMLDEIFAEHPSEEETKQFFIDFKRESLIKEYSLKLDKASEYLKTTKDSVSQLVSKVEDMVVSSVDVLDNSRNQVISLTKGIKEEVTSLAEDPGQLGVDLGFGYWQSAIGQLRNRSVTFVAATAKAGKSQFALSAALKVARSLNLPVLVLDSELNERDQRIRLVGMLAEIPYNIIETGIWKMSEQELRANGIDEEGRIREIKEYTRRMNDPRLWEMAESLPIDYMSIDGLGVQEAIPYARRWLLTKVKPDKDCKIPQCLIVYDYIKLASVAELKNGKIQEWQINGLNVAALHDFAKQYNIPILAFGQTNNEIGGFRSIAGGKRIIENVTSISHLKKKDAKDKKADPYGSHIIETFGSRYGAGLGDCHINIDADLSCGKFREIGIGNSTVEEKSKDDNED